MLATIKVHSSLHKYFNQTELRADFNTYHDIIPYLSAMHPRFKHYMDMVNWGESNESFAFLDKNLTAVSFEELHIKRVHEDDIIYLAPVIVGGGGKKGNILALVAFAGLVVATGGLGAGALTAGATTTGTTAASLGMGGATGNLAASGALAQSTGGGILASFGGMGGFAMSLMGNIGMALLSSLFAKKPKEMETDTSTRAGGAFGSLANSTKSGTPIALHYGLTRVAGQMLSGYVDSDDHGKNDVIKVEDKF